MISKKRISTRNPPYASDSKRLRRSIKAREEETNLDEGESQKHEGIAFVTMEPTAFSHLIASAAALEVVTLSPQAFLEEVLYPRALMVGDWWKKNVAELLVLF